MEDVGEGPDILQQCCEMTLGSEMTLVSRNGKRQIHGSSDIPQGKRFNNGSQVGGEGEVRDHTATAEATDDVSITPLSLIHISEPTRPY